MKSKVEIDGTTMRMTRVFAAPRERLFTWWTSGEKMQQWSGCKEAIACEIEMDFRVGGTFAQKMTIRGAGEFSLRGTYSEIVVPELIVYQAEIGPATVKVTVEFQSLSDGTQIVMTHEGLPSEFYCTNISHGTDESFEKLDSLLSQSAAAA